MDVDGYEIAATARIYPSNGDIAWIPSYETDKANFRTVATSQMTSMLSDRSSHSQV